MSINGPIETSDSPTYLDSAMSLYYHFRLNEYRPPVYPLGLMLVGILFYWSNVKYGIVVLQILISMLNIFFLYLLINEAFENNTIACLSSLITSVSYRVFSWDFVVLTENFAIFIITLVTYFTIKYIKYKQINDLGFLCSTLLIAIFIKPFFLLLPFAVFLIFILRKIIIQDFTLKLVIRVISTGAVVIYLNIFAYSIVNYLENSYFGLTSVGDVNYFGKVLQYNMENLGRNDALKNDIRFAFNIEKPEYKVNGKYLEPWHFAGTYGWAYSEVGQFSKDIILGHPIRFTIESLKLTYELFVYNSPFKDYIADAALQKAGHIHPLFKLFKNITDYIDLLYVLLPIYFLVNVIGIFLSTTKRLSKKNSERVFFKCLFMNIILYHYIISAFFSYGDYCRLLTPCYPLIYTTFVIIIRDSYQILILKFAYKKTPY